MEILQSELGDLEAILSLYDAATALQQSKGTVQWPKISPELVEAEIRGPSMETFDRWRTRMRLGCCLS